MEHIWQKIENKIKNFYIKIFKRKQYKESLEIMNKLLGIEKPDTITIFNIHWNKGATRLSLINYKNVWVKNGNDPEYTIYDNGPAYDGTCYELTVIFGYYIFTFIKFDCNWHRLRWKLRYIWENKGKYNKNV